MAAGVRQRVPFHFSEDGEADIRILDEQEQEEVIDRLRKENKDSNIAYFVGLQAVIGLSFFIHAMYLFSSSKVSPLAPLFGQESSPSKPVPLATGLTILQVLVHVNLSLYCLPPKHPYRQLIPNLALPWSLSLPFPLSHPIAIVLPTLAPTYALVLGCARVDVIWWSVSGLLTAVVALATKWMKDGEKDIEELEKLRYTAPGA